MSEKVFIICAIPTFIWLMWGWSRDRGWLNFLGWVIILGVGAGLCVGLTSLVFYAGGLLAVLIGVVLVVAVLAAIILSPSVGAND